MQNTNSEQRDPIPAEDDFQSEINPGASLPLEIEPDEGLDDDQLSEEWLPGETIQIGKPEKDDWVAIYSREGERSFTTQLLVQKSKIEFNPRYYYVDKPLRSAVQRSMKRVRVILYYSFLERRFGLWIVGVSPGIGYYESIAQLLSQEHEFLANHQFMVFADQGLRRYRVRKLPITRSVNWPSKPIGQLLATALGEDRMIMNAEHTVYQQLTAGEEMEIVEIGS